MSASGTWNIDQISGVALVLCTLWAWTPTVCADETDGLRATLERQMDAGDWKKARSTAKKLMGKVDDTERPAVEDLRKTIESELAWEKFAKKLHRARKNPRQQLALVERFLRKHDDNELLQKRGEAAREEARGRIYHLLEDFENPQEMDPDLRLETERVKHGKGAGHLKLPRERQMSIYIECQEKDWSGYSALVMWIYSAKKSGRLTIDVMGEGRNYFEAYNNVDWVGWKEVRIPLAGKGSRFARHGNPEWYQMGVGLVFPSCRWIHGDNELRSEELPSAAPTVALQE